MACEIYSDESGNSGDRFESIGTLSVKSEKVEEIGSELKGILSKFNLEYCEYKKIRDDHHFLCAQEIIHCLIKYAIVGSLKIMVLTWDKHDSRHTIRNRDDQKNMSIMYYHAIKNTKRLWFNTNDIDSNFYPDELNKVDFENIIRYIENSRIKKISHINETLFGVEFSRLFPKILDHSQVVSKNEIFIQCIDIITGIVRLSHEEYGEFCKWKQNENIQTSLFGEGFLNSIIISKSKEYKYKLILYLNDLCKQNKLSIALESTKSFHSHRPSCGIWFWKYLPKRISDKAPTS